VETTFEKFNANLERISKTATSKSAPVSSSTSGLKAENIFGMMGAFLDRGEGKPLISKVASTFGFEIVLKKGGPV
jgi:3-hydroxyacyl-CoA dehydrogenase/3a,7a,12a-trihydroxy-5b-cholest-24-enoyl-CoA hydratase